MTVTYHSGERIQGLAYTASNITKDENFSNVWLSGNTTYADINTSTEKIEFDWDNGDGSTDKQINVDLGSVSTNWIVRFKLNWSVATSSSNAYMYVGLTDNAGGTSTSQSGFMMRFINAPSAGSEYVNFGANQINSTLPYNLGGSGANMTYTTDTDHYVELKKNGTSLTATIWTGSYGGTQVATQTITTTITPSLKYLHFWNSMSANTGTWEGTFEDVKFWNNATSTSGTPTYDYNLANASVWSQDPADSQFTVSSSDGRLNFLENASSGGDRTWLDLGTGVSETQWILRFKLRFTTIATQSDYPEIDIGISDNHANSDTNQDFIGCRILPMAANNLFRPRKCIAEKPRRGASASHNPSPAFTTGKDYYIEFKRTSANDWSASLSDTDAYDGDIYSGSFTNASTSLNALRYITVMDGTTATSGNMEGYIDDVEFYNDATTPIKTAIGDEKPTNVELASRFEETDTRKIYYRMDSDYETAKWYELGTVPYAGGRGVLMGGNNTNVIQYFTIDTLGNTTDFGDITQSVYDTAGCANVTRAIRGGGFTSNQTNVMDYVTIATTGDATDFGDLTVARNRLASFSNDTRGIWSGGSDVGGFNTIDYVTIASTGNATDFGDLTATTEDPVGCANATRGLTAGGSGNLNTITYVTIASTGNATDFGDLTVGRRSAGASANATRAVFGGGGYGDVNTIDYVTVATTGNATDFGDLLGAIRQLTGVGSSTRIVFCGGNLQNVMQYVTIDTPSNATDFGDLLASNYGMAGASDYVR